MLSTGLFRQIHKPYYRAIYFRKIVRTVRVLEVLPTGLRRF